MGIYSSTQDVLFPEYLPGEKNSIGRKVLDWVRGAEWLVPSQPHTSLLIFSSVQ